MLGSTSNKQTKKIGSQVYRPCSVATSNNLNLKLESRTNSFVYHPFDLLLNRTTTMDHDMLATMAMLTSTKTRRKSGEMRCDSKHSRGLYNRQHKGTSIVTRT